MNRQIQAEEFFLEVTDGGREYLLESLYINEEDGGGGPDPPDPEPFKSLMLLGVGS